MKSFLKTLSIATFSVSLCAFAEDSKPELPLIQFEVPKMMCGSCTSRVTKSIQNHPGVSAVSVTLDDHMAKFICDEKAGCDVAKIKKDLARIQYPARDRSK